MMGIDHKIKSVENDSANLKTSDLCSVLIPSYDGFSDLWDPFFTLFWRYWDDCPFQVFLGTNKMNYNHPRVKIIHSGHGKNWTNRVKEQIEAIDTPYVLMMLEDFFIRQPVDTTLVLKSFESLLSLSGEMIRLTPRPRPDVRVEGHPLIGRIKPNAPYRTSTQVAIWRRQTLLDLMKENETIWEFEGYGSRRSDIYVNGFYCTWKQVIPYGFHVVERGEWFRHEARRFKAMDIGCDFSRRPIMNRRNMLKCWYSKHSGLLRDRLIPWKIRKKIKKILQVFGFFKTLV